ncbi:MAG: hypothetical protein Q4D62_09850 [Planctomycetia bacterium]|nr:hypothetical protein [Planctomycetia bacterium]
MRNVGTKTASTDVSRAVEEDELEGIDWDWHSANGCQIKVPLATESTGVNPTDRGKWDENQRLKGKYNLYLDGGGSQYTFSIVVCGVNRHDSIMLEPLLVERFVPAEKGGEDDALHLNLCLKTCYVNRKEVVEAFHTWLKHFRKLSSRYEKTDHSYDALLHLAMG